MTQKLPARFLAPAALLIVLSTASAAMAQEGEGQQLRIPAVGLTMHIPAEWQEGGFSGEAVLASYVQGSGLYPGFSMTRENHDGAGPQAVFDAWTALLSAPTVNAVEELRVSGRPALFADVSWTSLLGDLRAVRLIVGMGQEVLVLSFNDRSANLTPERAEDYRAYLESVSLAPEE